MDTIHFCPLGKQCEEAKKGKLYRCNFYIHLRGKNPQSEEEIDEWDCAIKWQPLLLVESSQVMRQNQAAIEGFRNIFRGATDSIVSILSQFKNVKEIEVYKEAKSIEEDIDE